MAQRGGLQLDHHFVNCFLITFIIYFCVLRYRRSVLCLIRPSPIGSFCLPGTTCLLTAISAYCTRNRSFLGHPFTITKTGPSEHSLEFSILFSTMVSNLFTRTRGMAKTMPSPKPWRTIAINEKESREQKENS